MAAGAEMIEKHMKAVGILAGSGHLDNPITNSIKTNPTLKRHLFCEFDDIDIECLCSLLKEKAVNGTYGLESVLNKPKKLLFMIQQMYARGMRKNTKCA